MPRVAFYAHDTYGLGHLSRCLKLAEAFAGELPGVRGVILSGSPWHALFAPPAGSIEVARTVAVNALVVAEIFYLLNTRYIFASAFSVNCLFENRYVLIAIAVVLVFQALFTYLPLMQMFFRSAPISVDAWLRIVATGLMLFITVELEKLLMRRIRGSVQRLT